MVNKKDGGDLMNEMSINEMLTVHKFVVENITVTEHNKVYGYKDFCGVYCNDSNAIVLAFVQVILTFINFYYLFCSVFLTKQFFFIFFKLSE